MASKILKLAGFSSGVITLSIGILGMILGILNELSNLRASNNITLVRDNSNRSNDVLHLFELVITYHLFT
jgi:hypothetical protein